MKAFLVCVVLLFSSQALAAVTLTIDELSPWGDPNLFVRGTVTGVDFSLYDAFVSAAPQGVGFWSKAYIDSPDNARPTVVNQFGKFDCSWSVGTTTNTGLMDRIASDFVVTLYKKTNEPIPGNWNSRGIPNYGYDAIAYKERWGRTIELGGQTFGVKSSEIPVFGTNPGSTQAVGPNNNIFSSSPSSVYKDADSIHLTVNNMACTEIVALDKFGLGTYVSVMNIGNIPAGVTVAPGYLFDVFGDVTIGNQNREIDIELGDVAVKNGGHTAQFAMQGYGPTVNAFDMSTIGQIRSTISLRPKRIDFKLENLDTLQVQTWTYTGADLPKEPGQIQFRINAWISDKNIYNPAVPLDVEVKSFTYAALQPDPTPNTKVWTGNGTPDYSVEWDNTTNWVELPDVLPPGYGGKVTFGNVNQVDSVVSMPFTPITLGQMAFVGQRTFEHIDGDNMSSVHTLIFNNGYANGISGQLRDATVTVNAGVPQHIEFYPAIQLDGNLQIVIDNSTDSIRFEGNIKGNGTLILPNNNAGRIILSPSLHDRTDYPEWQEYMFKYNTYSGGTIVNGGILEIAETHGLPNGSDLTIGDNGTVVINMGVMSQLGKIIGTGDLLVNGSLTADSICQDTLTIGAGASVTIRETTTQANEVPEPGVLLLVCAGLATLILGRKIWIGC